MNARLYQDTILVVDDEPQVLSAIADTLEDEYRIVVQTSPRNAIKIVENERDLSVIITDQRMPGMTGDEFLARACEISDASRVMITGYADLRAVVRAVNNGKIFSYISKPWDPEQLKLVAYKAVEYHRLVRELSEEQRLLHNLMDHFPDAIFFKNLESRFVRVNRVQAARLGTGRPENVVGRPMTDFFSPDEALEREAEDSAVIHGGVALMDQVRRIVMPGGEARWTSTTKAPIKNERGEVTGLVGITRDISERKLADEKIKYLNRVYAVLSGINSTIVRVHDRDELFRDACRIAVEAGQFAMAWIGVVDRQAMRILPVAWHGVDRSYVEALPLGLDAAAGDRYGLAGRAVAERKAMISDDVTSGPHILLREEAGRHRFRSLVVLPLLVAGEAVGALALYAAEVGFFDEEEMKLLRELAGDISFALDHIEKEERLNYLAFHDDVTGLANRTLFHEHLRQAVHAAARQHHACAVLNVNLDRFKAINDTLGRQAGDALLRQVAERIARAVRNTDQVARISADQFSIVFPVVKGEDEVARLIEEMTKRWFGEPYQLDGTELRISAKAGIALYPNDGEEAETLFRNSEAALDRAKATGERYLFYTQQMTERIAEKLTLENKLRRALEREEFVLHYQPKVGFEDHRIAGVEALIRWMSPERGLVPPGEFIPLMEETGLILEVGAWALSRAVADHLRWLEQGLAAPRVAVNVSAIQLRKTDFFASVENAIKHGATPPGIDLEITESLVMEDIESNIQKLKQVRALGIGIAIDDFGTGYSSLGYLAKLPVQSLKIDRSFIIEMLNNPDTLTLVRTIISLAQSLKLKVAAEGVDSEEQARFLRLLRCDEMQGYLFSRPVSFEDMTAMLKQGGPDQRCN